MLVTFAAILVGPIQGPITPVGLTALIVPALAAALIGGLKSVPITIAGGIGLGMANSLLARAHATTGSSGRASSAASCRRCR